MNIQIFADTADQQQIFDLLSDPRIQGITTNPTLMRAAGVRDYESWARATLAFVPHKPVSLEVLADDFATMEKQARLIASWGPNVYVKIPITNTRGESACSLIRTLCEDGVKVNVTAILTLGQMCIASNAVANGVAPLLSVFAGRIADTGVDPLYPMEESLRMANAVGAQLVWASAREVLNVYQAERMGCHVITLSPSLIAKLDMQGRDLTDLSLDTVKMFYRDAREAGYTL